MPGRAWLFLLSFICAGPPAWGALDSAAAFRRMHDPSTIVPCKDQYWMFSTGPGVRSWSSPDLTNWNSGPAVFSGPPPWTAKAVPGNRGYFWAPDVIQLGKQYFLYYSVSTWGKNTSAIGLATNSSLDPADPRFGWKDAGLVIGSSPPDTFNSIDPSVFLDHDHRLWLAFGSYWSGIKMVELNPETGLRTSRDSPLHSLAANDSIEAAALFQEGTNAYLFVNWGQCCRGTNSTYEIRVGRSASIVGPYMDREGKYMMQHGGDLFLGSEGPRIGPGHAGILRLGSRQFFSYHFYDAENEGQARLGIRALKWSREGWPELGPVLPFHLN
jgi:arabinan endo-1,5-alpha-L-arabinosidase